LDYRPRCSASSVASTGSPDDWLSQASIVPLINLLSSSPDTFASPALESRLLVLGLKSVSGGLYAGLGASLLRWSRDELPYSASDKSEGAAVWVGQALPRVLGTAGPHTAALVSQVSSSLDGIKSAISHHTADQAERFRDLCAFLSRELLAAISRQSAPQLASVPAKASGSRM
jgi:hypothetical protein